MTEPENPRPTAILIKGGHGNVVDGLTVAGDIDAVRIEDGSTGNQVNKVVHKMLAKQKTKFVDTVVGRVVIGLIILAIASLAAWISSKL